MIDRRRGLIMGKGVVMITGASRGIGRACALRFAIEGYDLALCCHHNTALLEELCLMIRQLSAAAPKSPPEPVRVLAFTGDMGSWEETQSFFCKTQQELGDVDILINNAGISYIGLLTDMQPEDWQKIMASNLDSVFHTCRLAIPSMVRRKAGRILNVSSVWGCSGASCEAAYSASKGGVNAFTQALAKELAPSGIAVNAVAFGAVDTDMNAGFSSEERTAISDEIPAGRFASAKEAADLLFRLSQMSPYLTGQVIRYDGGWL